MILQQVRALLQQIDIEGATPEKLLGDDLGMDSQERLCFREDIERHLNIALGDNELDADLTVAGLAALISRKQLPIPAPSGFDGILIEDVTIAAPLADVRQGLFDVASWPAKLPHVTGITVAFDDGRYQEFTMDVDGADGKPISVRSVRRCVEDRITFFQPKPPAFLRHHCGEWFFRELDTDLTHLTTVHRWNLADNTTDQEAERITRLLRDHACLALATWKRILEGGVS
jgi:acyl carrier protein